MAGKDTLFPDHSDILVLSILKDGDQYGYSLISALEKSAENPFHLKEGALYPLLHTLEQHHYVKSYNKDAPTGRSRRYYRLTKSGETYLKKHSAGGTV